MNWYHSLWLRMGEWDGAIMGTLLWIIWNLFQWLWNIQNNIRSICNDYLYSSQNEYVDIYVMWLKIIWMTVNTWSDRYDVCHGKANSLCILKYCCWANWKKCFLLLWRCIYLPLLLQLFYTVMQAKVVLIYCFYATFWVTINFVVQVQYLFKTTQTHLMSE